MTLQEIANLCGVGLRTVQRWIDKMTCHSDSESGTAEAIKHKLEAANKGAPARFDERETALILRSGNRAELAGVLAGGHGISAAANEERLMRLIEAVTELVRETRGLVSRAGASSEVAPRQSHRALPAVDPGARVQRLMREYGTQLRHQGHDNPFAAAWHRLSAELYDRTRFDAGRASKRTSKTRLEVIEESGHVLIALQIAERLASEPGRRALADGLG